MRATGAPSAPLATAAAASTLQAVCNAGAASISILPRYKKEVKEIYDSLGRCVVAVSEGIQGDDDEYFLKS